MDGTRFSFLLSSPLLISVNSFSMIINSWLSELMFFDWLEPDGVGGVVFSIAGGIVAGGFWTDDFLSCSLPNRSNSFSMIINSWLSELMFFDWLVSDRGGGVVFSITGGMAAAGWRKAVFRSFFIFSSFSSFSFISFKSAKSFSSCRSPSFIVLKESFCTVPKRLSARPCIGESRNSTRAKVGSDGLAGVFLFWR